VNAQGGLAGLRHELAQNTRPKYVDLSISFRACWYDIYIYGVMVRVRAKNDAEARKSFIRPADDLHHDFPTQSTTLGLSTQRSMPGNVLLVFGKQEA